MERLYSNGMSTSINERVIEMYHKNIDADSNRRIVQEFCKQMSHIRLLFIYSTVAFGMGVQIPDVI